MQICFISNLSSDIGNILESYNFWRFCWHCLFLGHLWQSFWYFLESKILPTSSVPLITLHLWRQTYYFGTGEVLWRPSKFPDLISKKGISILFSFLSLLNFTFFYFIFYYLFAIKLILHFILS